MTQGQDNDLNNKECNENLKALHSKLGSISGFLITMRSEDIEEYKKISHDLKTLIKQVHTMQKSMEIYFIIISILLFFMIQKMFWTTSSINLSLLTNLF